jgi:hypothetical protein
MGFDPCNHSLKIWESTETPTPNMEVHLGSVSVHFHTLPRSRVFLLARALVSPCLGRDPKARVATCTLWSILVNILDMDRLYGNPTLAFHSPFVVLT